MLVELSKDEIELLADLVAGAVDAANDECRDTPEDEVEERARLQAESAEFAALEVRLRACL